MSRFLWLCYGALIIYSIVASVDIPWVAGGGRGIWWNNECVFANWRNIAPLDYTTNEAVYGYYSGRSAVHLREETSVRFTEDFKSGRTFFMGLDYYAVWYTSSPLPGPLLEDYGRALEDGAVLTVESGVLAGGRYMKVILVSGYP